MAAEPSWPSLRIAYTSSLIRTFASLKGLGLRAWTHEKLEYPPLCFPVFLLPSRKQSVLIWEPTFLSQASEWVIWQIASCGNYKSLMSPIETLVFRNHSGVFVFFHSPHSPGGRRDGESHISQLRDTTHVHSACNSIHLVQLGGGWEVPFLLLTQFLYYRGQPFLSCLWLNKPILDLASWLPEQARDQPQRSSVRLLWCQERDFIWEYLGHILREIFLVVSSIQVFEFLLLFGG